MAYKVNNQKARYDGDWIECPKCYDKDFPLLSWMLYCPMCQEKLEFKEYAE